MNRIVLLLVFVFASGIALAQTEPINKTVPTQVQAGSQSKKIGISSASRRNALPGRVQPNAKADADPNGPKADGPKKHPHGGAPGNPNRPDVRVPKNRPGGPITRPGLGPGNRPDRPQRPGGMPGNRPNAPGQRPPGG